jgi:gliding motility-associated-like protein
MKTPKKYTTRIIIFFITMILTCSQHIAAQFVNPGFETGDLTGWSGSAGTSVSTGMTVLSWTVNPANNYMAAIEPTTSLNISTAESNLGLSSGALVASNSSLFSTATNFATLTQVLILGASQSVTINWNFIAQDYAPFNDGIIATLVGPSGQMIELMAVTANPYGDPDAIVTGDYGSTGWLTVSFTAPVAGSYTLGFASFNTGDQAVNPILIIDDGVGGTFAPGQPILTTKDVTDIGTSSATCGGDITSDGGADVTARGVCWNTAGLPVISDAHTSDGTGTGIFTSSVTGLSINTMYYLRSYATNSAGTVYGEQVIFTTLSVSTEPIVTTTSPSMITSSSASSGGNITSDGGSAVTARGVCWNTSGSPTVSDNSTTDGTGAGVFVSLVSGLEPDKTYYVKAYATNSVGTAYGTEDTFTTLQTQTITFPELPEKTYGDNDFAAGASASSGITIQYTSSDAAIATISGGDIHITGAGTCTIYANQPGNAAYSSAPEVSNQLTVSKATLTLTADDKQKNYGESNPLLTFSGNSFFNGDDIDDIDDPPVAATEANEQSSPNNYAITLTGGSDNNYDIITADGVLEVSKANLTVTADDLSKSYGEADPELTYQITSGILVGSDAMTGSITRAPGEDADTYIISKGTLTAGPNYNMSFTNDSLVINRAELEITADSKTKTYGETDPTMSYSITDGSLVGTDTVSGNPERIPGEDVNAYTIGHGSVSAGDNYDLVFVEGVFTIQQVALEVTADNYSKIYGDDDPELTFGLTGGSVVGSDAITGIPVRVSGEDVGSYSIGQGTISAGANYDIAFNVGTFTIDPVILEITGEDQIKTFSDDDPVLTYQITDGSLIGSDSLTGSLSRESGEDAGAYLTEKGTLTTSGNYEITYMPGSLTIEPAPLQITVYDTLKVYGEGDPAFHWNITGGSLFGIDSVTGTFTREPGEDAGYYEIQQGSVNAGDNYDITFIGGILTVTQAALAVSADNLVKVYGEADPEFSFHITSGSLVGSDAITGEIYRDADEKTGSYPLMKGTLTAGPNYILIFVDGALDITKAQLTLSADHVIRQYGEENPELTYKGSGFKFDDDVDVLDALPSLHVSADILSNAGDYAITITGGSDNNYNFTYAEGTLTVEKASLMVKADDKSKKYLETNPVLTCTYSGFVNDDDISVIDNLSVLSTEADESSWAGSYNIVPSGGSDNNYYFVYVNGDLVNEKADQTIVFDPLPEGLRTTETYMLRATASSGLKVTFGTSDPTILLPDDFTDAIMVLSEGSVIISALQAGDNNWNTAQPVTQSILTLPVFDNSNSLFTPNDDGMNDYWYIPYIEEYGQVRAKVYNRYGKLVYVSEAYENDWDGTSNGNELPEGSYYYIIDSSAKGSITGVINIIR